MVEDFEGSGFSRIAANKAVFLECGEMCVHGGWGGEADRRSHFSNAGRIPLLQLIRANEVIDLLLALGYLPCHDGSSPTKHLFEYSLTGTTVRT